MSAIEWTNRTWNPVRGCSRVSEGCRNCYAELIAARFAKPGEPFHGFAKVTAPRDALDRVGGRRNGWTGRVELIPEKLDEPLRWRKPQRVFVNSMSDLFHEALSDEAIAAVFGIMAAAPGHTFQVLTKRAERMRAWFRWASARPPHAMTEHALGLEAGACDAMVPDTWPLPNVWLGCSPHDQESADRMVPLLRHTPAAVRFISVEPLLEQVDLCLTPGEEISAPFGSRRGIHWVIVGGESGPGARPCDVAWIRSVVRQCREAGVACFVKQLGARPITDHRTRPAAEEAHWTQLLRHPKGGDPAEWPEDLRVREFPR